MKLKLSNRFFALYGFVQLLGVMSFVAPMALVGWGALSIVLLIASIVDRRQMALASDVKASVIVPRDPRLGEPASVEVTLTVLNKRWFRQSKVRLFAPPIPLLDFKTRHTDIDPRHLPKETYTRSFKAVVGDLGYVKLDHVTVTIHSPSGLYSGTIDIPIEPVEFRAAPERRKLAEQAFQELIQTQKVLYQGARRVARSRAAEQFHSIRKYQYPDPVRHIDAKKSARYNEPMTRVFESQHNHHLIIGLDTGRSMIGDVRGSRKSDYYASAALALAENAVRSRDRVSLFSFAGAMRAEIRGARSLAAFLPIFRASKEFTPVSQETNYRLVPDAVSRASGSRAIVVILTDLSKPSVQDALLEALASVCRKHLTVVVSLSDSGHDLETHVMDFKADRPEMRQVDSFKDLYSELLYSYYTREKLILFREHFSKLGGGSLAVNERDWIATVERLYDLLRSSQLA
ncbi:MAG: DUF58 domain-containing protein [Bdellovibrionota bacterium]